MRASAIRARLSLLAVGILFAACGGRAMVPSQSESTNGAFASNVVEHASPCANSMLQWYFHGACKGFTLTSTGGKVTLPAYKGAGVLVKIGANTPGGNAFLAGDATGARDITGKSAFPLYSQAKCSPGLTCPGKSRIYVEIANVSATTTTLTGSISLTVTAKSFPGKHCFPATLGMSLGGVWQALAGLAKPVKNGKVTITIPGVTKIPLPPGVTAYIALACQ